MIPPVSVSCSTILLPLRSGRNNLDDATADGFQRHARRHRRGGHAGRQVDYARLRARRVGARGRVRPAAQRVDLRWS